MKYGEDKRKYETKITTNLMDAFLGDAMSNHINKVVNTYDIFEGLLNILDEYDDLEVVTSDVIGISTMIMYRQKNSLNLISIIGSPGVFIEVVVYNGDNIIDTGFKLLIDGDSPEFVCNTDEQHMPFMEDLMPRIKKWCDNYLYQIISYPVSEEE